MSNNLIVLAIETSCDETTISIIRYADNSLEILSNEISSQVALHAKFGGVVPNLAAREHVKNISWIFEQALKKAALGMKEIDLIAVTNGPGLIPALLVGVNFAKTLAYIWDKPLSGIHHIEGHIYANFIENKISGISNNQLPISKKIPRSQNSKKNSKKDFSSLIENSLNIKFPILCLVVSGGHTQLVFMKNHLNYEIIGQTLDDAVGEAFDKVARILNIGYPGGPAIAKQAANFQFSIHNLQSNPASKIKDSKINLGFEIRNSKFGIKFPRPMLNKPGYNFSFSGLKTAVLYETKKNSGLLKNKKYLVEVCHEFQQACIDVLVSKTIKAAKQYKSKTIMLAGGVSANQELRKQLGEAVSSQLPMTNYLLPLTELTGDNAAMIAAAAVFRWQKMNSSQKKKTFAKWQDLQTDANLKLK